MTGHHHEKYIRINMDWPNKAGHLRQVLATQKRLLSKISPKDENTKALMVSVAEGYDTATDLLQWMETTLKEVGQDAYAIAPGSKVRTELDWTTQLLGEFMTVKREVDERKLDHLRK